MGLKIYIAGPYSSPDAEIVDLNVKLAIDTGIELLKRGHYPFIPHLTHFVELRSKQKQEFLSWEDYIEWDLEYLKICDALLFLDSSAGADIELEKAIDIGLDIFFDSRDIPDAKEMNDLWRPSPNSK